MFQKDLSEWKRHEKFRETSREDFSEIFFSLSVEPPPLTPRKKFWHYQISLSRL